MAFITVGVTTLSPPLRHRPGHQTVNCPQVPRKTPRRGRVRAAVADGNASHASETQPNEASRDARRSDVVSSLLSALSSAADAVADAAFAPVASCSVLARQWESRGGNVILRPPGRARAVLHFIGGAFVGAIPHFAYRSLLERLASRGYCIVASPYDLSMDYLALVSDIAHSWESVETDLALEYGAVPVVGVGHSAGALFQALTSSLFADVCPKAGNILISFNNKAASDAIPLYEGVFAPAFATAANAERFIPPEFADAMANAPNVMEDVILGSPITPRRVRENVIPTLRESRRLLTQLPMLFREIGGVVPFGAENDRNAEEYESNSGKERGPPPEFYPPPNDVRASVEAMYSAGQTLVVKFENDGIDESSKVEAMIRARCASPDAEGTSVTLVELPGTHITPLAQDVPGPVLSGVEAAAQKFWNRATGSAGGNSAVVPIAVAVSATLQELADATGGKEMHRLEELIDEWIQAGIANGYL